MFKHRFVLVMAALLPLLGVSRSVRALDTVLESKFDSFLRMTPSNNYVVAGMSSGSNVSTVYIGGQAYPKSSVQYISSGSGSIEVNLFGKLLAPYSMLTRAKFNRDLDTVAGVTRLLNTRSTEINIKFFGNTVRSQLTSQNGDPQTQSFSTPSITIVGGSAVVVGITLTGKVRGSLSLTAKAKAAGKEVYAFPMMDEVESSHTPSANLEAYGSATVVGFGAYGALTLAQGNVTHHSRAVRFFDHIGFAVMQSDLTMYVDSLASLNMFGGELGLATPVTDIKLVSWGAPARFTTALNPTWVVIKQDFLGFI